MPPPPPPPPPLLPCLLSRLILSPPFLPPPHNPPHSPRPLSAFTGSFACARMCVLAVIYVFSTTKQAGGRLVFLLAPAVRSSCSLSLRKRKKRQKRNPNPASTLCVWRFAGGGGGAAALQQQARSIVRRVRASTIKCWAGAWRKCVKARAAKGGTVVLYEIQGGGTKTKELGA